MDCGNVAGNTMDGRKDIPRVAIPPAIPAMPARVAAAARAAEVATVPPKGAGGATSWGGGFLPGGKKAGGTCLGMGCGNLTGGAAVRRGRTWAQRKGVVTNQQKPTARVRRSLMIDLLSAAETLR